MDAENTCVLAQDEYVSCASHAVCRVSTARINLHQNPNQNLWCRLHPDCMRGTPRGPLLVGLDGDALFFKECRRSPTLNPRRRRQPPRAPRRRRPTPQRSRRCSSRRRCFKKRRKAAWRARPPANKEEEQPAKNVMMDEHAYVRNNCLFGGMLKTFNDLVGTPLLEQFAAEYNLSPAGAEWAVSGLLLFDSQHGWHGAW